MKRARSTTPRAGVPFEHRRVRPLAVAVEIDLDVLRADHDLDLMSRHQGAGREELAEGVWSARPELCRATR
jgi:hypothetical protein